MTRGRTASQRANSWAKVLYPLINRADVVAGAGFANENVAISEPMAVARDADNTF